MAEVVVSSESLTVLGGPANISVDVDFGPQGSRGSYILVGNGQPNDPNTVIGQDPRVLDLYINILSSDPEYMFIYQYLNTGIENTWVKLMKLTPNSYSLNNEVEFVDGTATVQIPLSAIVPSYPEILANTTADNFNVQINIANQSPIASSVSVGEIIIDPITSNQILPLNISAAEFDSSGAPKWVDLSGTKTVHLFITVV